MTCRNLALLALLAAGQAVAAPTTDELLKRIEQLERQQQATEQALESERLSEEEPARKDMELHALGVQGQGRMIEVLEGITVAADLVTVAQSTAGGRGASQLNYRGDISITLPGGEYGQARGRLFSHFRLGQGDGLTGMGDSFSAPNATVFADANGAGNPILAQVWYQMDVPLGDDGSGNWPMQHMEISVGKMDPFLFFDQNTVADDETAGFMNSAFVHNPLLDAGGDVAVDDFGFTPGLRLAYHNEQGDVGWWRVSVGAFSAGSGAAWQDSFTAPFVIVQAESAGRIFRGLDGNYRIYGWNNGQASEFNDGGVSERHSGWGVSAAQRAGDYTTLFGRFGASTAGKVKFDQAVTLGVEFDGGYWGWDGDAVGVAAGWLSPSAAYQDNTGFGTAEEVVELFYRWQLNEQVAITPDVQRVRNPAGEAGARTRWFAGIRAAVNF